MVREVSNELVLNRDYLLTHYQNLSDLDRLDLSSKGFTDIEERVFEGLPNLRELYLNENKITSLKKDVFIGAYPHLETLTLTGNNLGEFSNLKEVLRKFKKLSYLELQNCGLSNISEGTFDDMKELSYLDLSRNRISVLSKTLLKNLPLLKNLYLGGNELDYIEKGTFENNKILEEISLGGCKYLETLEDGVFGDLPNLIDLNLCMCSLRDITLNTFKGLPKLSYLNLSNNKEIKKEYFTFDILTEWRENFPQLEDFRAGPHSVNLFK